MIVHLIGQLGRGGAEKQLFLLASALARRGWQQAVVSFLPGGVWEGHLAESGIPVCSIPRTSITPWRFWRLRRLIRSRKPRVIVSWSAHMAVYADWLFGVGLAARVINVRGDLTKRERIGIPGRRLGLLQRALQRADYVVANSRRSLDALRERGVRLPRTEVIYNIVADGKTPRPPHVSQVLRIVAVGSLIPLKSYDVLIEAVSLLATNGTDFELLLAGHGPERPRLESLANQLGIAERVKFLGDVEDVPGLLRTADVFAHPSITEGLSNAILEALAESLPVVACPVGATPEIIEDGRNGLLVAPASPRELAVAVRRLLVDGELRRRLGAAALETVRRCCDANVVVGQYEDVLKKLLA
jgi:glycosyltransferase involved in cell wall biosynthesis